MGIRVKSKPLHLIYQNGFLYPRTSLLSPPYPSHHQPQTYVHPSSPTPANQSPRHCLYLSNLDDIIGARVFTPSVYFYPSSNDQEYLLLKRLQDALAEVLVPYYPLSGRLREVENGKLQVFFGEEQGALMVSANSSMALADLGDLTVPNPAWLPLIFQDPDEEAYKSLTCRYL